MAKAIAPQPANDKPVVSTVKLIAGKQEREFSVEDAQNLLNYEKEKNFSNWELSPEQPFEYKDGVISPTGKRSTTDTGKSS